MKKNALPIVFVLACVLVIQPAMAQNSEPLLKIHQDIISDYPSLSHVSRAEVESRLEDSSQMLFDTRPMTEYRVGHLPGAYQIAPDAKPEELVSRFDVMGKDVVLYCSVGRRSSILGEAVQSALREAGARSVRNMEGGVFAWANDQRPLKNAKGVTQTVHPYNLFWGRLIKNKDHIRYRP